MPSPTFDPRKHPRSSDGSGQWTEKNLSDPGQILAAPAGDNPTLVEMLDRYGLTVGDVPGLAEAWQERFGVLAEPEPPTVERLTNQLMGSPEWGRHRGGPWLEVLDDTREDGTRSYTTEEPPGPDEPLVLRVHTRNGGGNRECWHDEDAVTDEHGLVDGCVGCTNEKLQQHPWYLTDRDDRFDCTYADFLFQVPDEHREAFVAAADTAAFARRWDSAHAALEAIRAGKAAPWNILATAEQITAHRDHVRELTRQLIAPWRREQVEAEIGQTDEFAGLLAGAPEPNDRQNPRIQIQDDSKASGARFIFRSDVVKAGVQAREARERAGRFARLRTEIESGGLSDELRDYLVGDRPPTTYQATEGSGRRARTVTRTYTPVSDFRQNEQKAVDDNRRYGATYREVEQLIVGHQAALRDRVARADAAQAQLDTVMREGEWALGWPGASADVPARPATADDVEDLL